MAKIYNDFQPANLMSFAKSFARLNGQPLDKSEIWYSYSEAAAYAATDAAYVGQILAVIDSDNNTVVFYGIQDAAGTLKEVGSTPVGDNSSVEIVDGKIQLKDFGSYYYAYVPATKDESGNIITPSSYVPTEGFKSGLEARIVASDDGFELAWYEPGSETVEDVAANVEGLNKEVENLDEVLNAEGGLVDQVDDLKDAVGTAATEAGDAATGLYAEVERLDSELAGINEELDTKADAETVNNALAEKANAADVYTKNEVDSAILNANHLKRTIVNSVEEINVNAEDADQYIYMVPTGLQADDDKYDEYLVVDGVVEKVGSWEVNLEPYATKEAMNTALAGKVDVVAGSRLMTETEGTKLAGIEEGAQVNLINEVSEEFTVSEAGLLEMKAISQDKVTNLGTDLENLNKAIEDEASRAAAAESALSGDVEQLKTDVDNVESSVSTLETKVEGKVDKVEGARLITDTEAEKLEALVIDEEGGIAISGTVNASKVQELYDTVSKIVIQSGTDIFDNVERPLFGIEVGAEVNIIDSVSNEFTISEDGTRKLSVNIIDASKIVNLSKHEEMIALTAKVNENAADIVTINAKYDTLATDFNSFKTVTEADLAEIKEHLTWREISNN